MGACQQVDTVQADCPGKVLRLVSCKAEDNGRLANDKAVEQPQNEEEKTLSNGRAWRALTECDRR